MDIGLARPDEYESLLAMRREFGWPEDTSIDGQAWVIRGDSGEPVGGLQLIDLAPDEVVVDAVLIAERHRGRGLGALLLVKALAARRGRAWLLCHEERVAFYERAGFAVIDDVPEGPVRDGFIALDDYPLDQSEHLHLIMVRGA